MKRIFQTHEYTAVTLDVTNMQVNKETRSKCNVNGGKPRIKRQWNGSMKCRVRGAGSGRKEQEKNFESLYLARNGYRGSRCPDFVADKQNVSELQTWSGLYEPLSMDAQKMTWRLSHSNVLFLFCPSESRDYGRTIGARL